MKQALPLLVLLCGGCHAQILRPILQAPPAGGGATVTVVQEAKNQFNGANCNNSTTTCAVSLTGVGAGHSLIYVCMGNAGTGQLTAATDNNSNTIALVKLNDSVSGAARIDWVASANSGNTTMTCNGAATERLSAHIWEVTLPTKAIDQTNNGTQTGTSQTISTSGATTAANELVMGVFFDNPSDDSWAAGSGFSPSLISDTGAGNESGISEVKIVSSTGTQTATATSGSGTNLIRQIIATFK